MTSPPYLSTSQFLYNEGHLVYFNHTKMRHAPLAFDLNIHIHAPRPDFRVVANFLFASHTHNFDSDGDSYPVSSRQWTELYLSSRVWKNYTVSIYALQNEPLILRVHASRPSISYAIAYFLALETQGQIFTPKGQQLSLQYLEQKLKNFALDRRLAIAKHSIWRESSEENPYPNLKNNQL